MTAASAVTRSCTPPQSIARLGQQMGFQGRKQATKAMQWNNLVMIAAILSGLALAAAEINASQQQQPATAAGPKYYLLNYSYVPDILEKRGPYREAHLAAAKKQLDAGRLVAVGAVGDPVEGAVFFFKNISKKEIEAYVAADPYVKNGLVPSWSIKPYAVVVGSP